MIIHTIYKCVNQINGKVYVGFDSCWPHRMTVHKSSSKKQDYKFYRAIRKYGWDNFEWSIVYQSKDKDYTLNVMENHFIKEYDSFNNGYNSTLGGEGVFGLILSDKAKKSISMKNKIPKPQTIEHIKKRTDSRMKNVALGITKPRIVSEETKRKQSLATKGVPKVFTEQHKKNLICHTNNKTKVSCPHCAKIGQLTNMKRWHFDNCKSIPQVAVVAAKQS